jgi:hypothetical protein
MKLRNVITLCLAVLAGYLFGATYHPRQALAQTRHTVYVNQYVGNGGFQAINGDQVVGFQCIGGEPNMDRCYVASMK